MSSPAPNFSDEKKIRDNQGILYELTSTMDINNNILILTCLNTSILCPYLYEIKLELDDFIRINSNFRIFINIEEIGNLISQLNENNKIQIENINNNENIKLFFNITNLVGTEERVEIVLEKKQLDNNELIKNLIEKVNNLIEENKTLNIKLNLLNNLIYHKIDSKIIQNENETFLIVNRLKQIPIFKNKKFLTHVIIKIIFCF